MEKVRNYEKLKKIYSFGILVVTYCYLERENY